MDDSLYGHQGNRGHWRPLAAIAYPPVFVWPVRGWLFLTPPLAAIDTHCYAHYLHHKRFRRNYTDGAIPLDKWFGSFHDGSDAAHEAISARLKAKSAGAREVQA